MNYEEDQAICLCGEVGEVEDDTHWIIQTTQGWKCVKKWGGHEPNQVTKDAIEEARKMNGETLSDEKLAEIAGQVPYLDANNVRDLSDSAPAITNRLKEQQ